MFKKIISSPRIFLTLAFLSLLIVFSAFFYAKTQMAGAKDAYWQYKFKRFFNSSSGRQTADPLITQANNSARLPTSPTVRPTDPTRGQPEAKITLVEFSDFACAYCNAVQPILKQVEATYKNQVRIIWKDFPLAGVKPEALQAARAAQCSRQQTEAGDKFWAYHDLLFANQNQLGYDNYLKWAKQLGLNERVFADCLASSETVNARLLQNIEEGNTLEISGTPTFYINNQLLSGEVTFDDFKKIIDAILVE